jgi:hypothetical protein
MAGEWIPIRVDLFDCPQVVRILSEICPDCVRDPSERVRRTSEVVGALVRMWSLFDRYTDNGELRGYSETLLDQVVGIEGFAKAVVSVGWLEVLPNGLKMPEFSKYLSTSAKTRMKDAQRKRAERAASASCPENVQNHSDKNRTTEEYNTKEKNTEIEIQTPPLSPKGEAVVEKPKRKRGVPDYDATAYRFSGHLDTPEVHETWLSFVEMRTGKGKKHWLTKTACEIIEKDFKDYSSADLSAALRKSIVSNWDGVFPPPKSTKSSKPDLPPITDREMTFDEFIARF